MKSHSLAEEDRRGLPMLPFMRVWPMPLMRQLLLLLLMLAGCMLMALWPFRQAMAATFPVSNATELRDAVQQSNTLGGSHTIILAPGTYHLTEQLIVESSITFIGDGGNAEGDPLTTVINAGGSNRAFDINPNLDMPGYNVKFQALTIQNGYVSPSADYGGGAVAADTGTSTIEFYNTVIRNNTASGLFGGGLYVSGETGGKLVLQRTAIENNSVNGDGGGLYIEGDFDVTIVDSEFIGNSAGNGVGGAIVNMPVSKTGFISIRNSTFAENEAGKGGAILLHSAAELHNSTISGNRASTDGGGIWLDLNGHSFTATNATIARNQVDSGDGGGIHINTGDAVLHNTIVAENNRGSSAPNDISGTVNSASQHNLIGIGGSGGLANGVNGNIVGVGHAGLMPLGDYGGHTRTHALAPDSPAIDNGHTVTAMLAAAFDQRGFPRKINGTSDIGAYEGHPDVEMAANSVKVLNLHLGDSANIDAVSASSSNPELVPNDTDHLQLSGTGDDRTLTIAPAAGRSGTAEITLTVNRTISGKAMQVSNTFTLNVLAYPDLTVEVNADKEPFIAGEEDVSYTVTVRNQGIGETSGTVSVTSVLSSDLILKNISGTGWACDTATLTCTRSDALPSGSDYPAITILADVKPDADDTASVSVTVSGGDDNDPANNSASVDTEIILLPTIAFAPDGNPAWAKTASTVVTVTAGTADLDDSSLQSVWSQSTAPPAAGWEPFANGTAVEKTNGDGVWYLHVKASDVDGREVTAVSGAFQLDNTDPDLDVTMQNADSSAYTDGEWTGQPVTISMSAADSGSGIASRQYSVDEGLSWNPYTAAFTLELDDSYNVWLRAEDAAGNMTQKTAVVRIDRTKPELTVELEDADGPYVSDTWVNSDVTLTASASDTGGSGVETLEYSLDSGATWQDYTGEVTISDGSHAVQVRAVDKAGNAETFAAAVKVDSTKPNVTVELETADGNDYADGTWVNQDIAFTATASDSESGIASTEYSLNGGTTWQPYTVPVTVSAEGETNVSIRAKNAAGLENVQSFTFMIDKTKPVLTVELENADGSPYMSDTWVNGDVTLTASASDTGGSGVETLEYSLDNGSTWTAYTSEVTLSNGVYAVRVRASDYAGNTETDSAIVKISDGKPILTFTMQTADSNAYTDGAWTNQPVTVSVYAEQPITGIKEITVSINGGSPQPYSNGSPIIFTAEGVHTIDVQAIDYANNVKAEQKTIKISYTPPSLLLTAAPTGLTNSSVTVTVTAGVYGTGNAIAQLKRASGDQTKEYFAAAGETIDIGDPVFQVSQNGIYTVYAEDLAGNGTVQTIAVTNINMVTPTIHLSAFPLTPTNGNVTVTVTSYVYGAGNAIIEAKWASGNRDAAYFAAGGNPLALDIMQFAVDANGTYTVYVRDLAGNEKVQTIGIGNIVKEAPLIEIAISPEVPTSDPVTVTVNASAAGSGSGNAIIALKWARGAQIADYFHSEGELLPTDAPRFETGENGTFTVYAKDLAGNEAVRTFEIRNIVPPDEPGENPDDPGNPGDPGNPDPGNPTSPGTPGNPGSPGGSGQSPDNGEQSPVKGQWAAIVMLNGTETMIQVIPSVLRQGLYELQLPEGTVSAEIGLKLEDIRRAVNLLPGSALLIHMPNSWMELPLAALLQDTGSNPSGIVWIRIQTLDGSELKAVTDSLAQLDAELVSDAIRFEIYVRPENGSVRYIHEFDYNLKRAFMADGEPAPEHTVVLWYDENTKEWRPVPARIEEDGGKTMVVFQRKGNSIYAAVRSSRTFADMQGHWAKAYVERLASMRIADGAGENAFLPDSPLTRAQFTAFLVRALAVSKSGKAEFADVPKTAWYADAVRRAKLAGLVDGYEDGTFRPDQTITREEMAVMIGRALQYAGAGNNGTASAKVLARFQDSEQIAEWAIPAVSGLVGIGLMEGDKDHLFSPKRTATRAEAAALLIRMLQYSGRIN